MSELRSVSARRIQVTHGNHIIFCYSSNIRITQCNDGACSTRRGKELHFKATCWIDVDHRPHVPFAKPVLQNITSENDFFVELSGHAFGYPVMRRGRSSPSVDNPHRFHDGLAPRGSANGSTNLVLGSELADLAGGYRAVPAKLKERCLMLRTAAIIVSLAHVDDEERPLGVLQTFSSLGAGTLTRYS